jgi:two-component system, NarL family, sensor kinase
MGKLSKSATGRKRAGREPAPEPSCGEIQQQLEHLRNLARTTLETQEAERRRVARELHDSVTQILSSAQFRLQQLDCDLAARDPASWREVLKCKVLVEKAIAEVGRICRNLRPPELDDLGLASAVGSLCREFTERTRIPVKVSLNSIPAHATGDLELHLFRIIQEALRNVEKHARANKVILSISPQGGFLHIVVSDNGRGFSGRTKTMFEGMGLRDMRERAALLGGICVVKSTCNKGTEVRVEVPITSSDFVKNNRTRWNASGPSNDE